MYTYMCIYAYMYTYRERQTERAIEVKREREKGAKRSYVDWREYYFYLNVIAVEYHLVGLSSNSSSDSHS